LSSSPVFERIWATPFPPGTSIQVVGTFDLKIAGEMQNHITLTDTARLSKYGVGPEKVHWAIADIQTRK
jgi:hypothetical protein